MKKIICSLFVILFAVSLSAQTVNADKKNTKVKEPAILFEKTEYDYGNIRQGDNGECEFVFKNTGKAPLILTNVHSSCGCTVPSWPKEPIEPGKKGTIKVKYNTNGLGTISKQITVESNAPDNARIILKIKGFVSEKPVENAPQSTESQLMKANNK